jgi:hypothetical protein
VLKFVCPKACRSLLRGGQPHASRHRAVTRFGLAGIAGPASAAARSSRRAPQDGGPNGARYGEAMLASRRGPGAPSLSLLGTPTTKAFRPLIEG